MHYIILLFSLFLATAATASEACTTIAGMSQTWDTCSFIKNEGGRNFACLMAPGQEIGHWASGSAWGKASLKANECSGDIYRNSTRVAVQLSAPDPSQNTRQRVKELSARVVSQVRSRFPNVQDIVLITSTGGPGGILCPVRDDMRTTRNCVMVGNTCYVRSSHQYNSQNWMGMVDYAAMDSAVSVYPSEVCACADYSDGKGHLKPRGGRCTAEKWINNTLVSTPAPVPDPDPVPTPDPEPEPDPEPIPEECPTTKREGQTWFNACYRYLGFRKPFTSTQRAEIRACVASCDSSTTPDPDPVPTPDPTPEPEPEPDPTPDPSAPQSGSEAYQQCKIDVLGGNRPQNRQERALLRECIRAYGF